jgi:hypothetical protein
MRSYAATGDPLFLAPSKLTLTRTAKDRATPRHAAVAGGDSRAEQPAEATTAKDLAELAELGQLLDSFVAGHDRKAHPALRTGPGP